MKRQILFLIYLSIFLPSILLGQDKPLKTIEPKLGFTPILNEKELQKELKKIQKMHELYNNDDYYKHATQRQIEIEDWDYEIRGDIFDVSQIGDGWYNCGWPKSITASSELNPTKNVNYVAKNAHDFSLRTAWVEGVEGYGIGESITYCFPKENPPITTIIIYNGYMKSDKAWQENSRVKQLKLYINNKPYALLNLNDSKSEQIFSIGSHKDEKSGLYLKFEIMDVYLGNLYDDVAISEIEFDGTGCLCFARGTMVGTPTAEKPIEQLAVGDTVLSFNTITNKVESATIVALAQRQHHLYELDFGGVKIKTTTDHPFYFEGKFYSIAENHTYGAQTSLLFIGQSISYLNNGKLEAIVLKEIKKLDDYENTYTITKLDKNNLFFANGICVATEETQKLK